MNVLHICLCGPVTDNWNYQDNLLPKYHKKLGYDVSIITSQWIWDENGNLKFFGERDYYNNDRVRVIRIPIKGKNDFNKKFKKYKNLSEKIVNLNPDILFIHGCQFLDIIKIKQYIKNHPKVKAYVDNHADFSNSATNWISKNFLHKIVWKIFAKIIEPYTKKFYGVLPARVNFLIEIYKVPKEKVELLIMGADDELIEKSHKKNTKFKIREKYGITSTDFLIMTGGKINAAKIQTLLLMIAINEIEISNIKLVVFGSVAPELQGEVDKLNDGKKIQYIGWISSKESYEYFNAADLVVFPGRHSIFWEQVVGQGIPALFKYWEGTTHVDVGGNCLFLVEDSVSEIKEKIEYIYRNPHFYNKMKEVAQTKGKLEFSYLKIAKESILE